MRVSVVHRSAAILVVAMIVVAVLTLRAQDSARAAK